MSELFARDYCITEELQKNLVIGKSWVGVRFGARGGVPAIEADAHDDS